MQNSIVLEMYYQYLNRIKYNHFAPAQRDLPFSLVLH